MRSGISNKNTAKCILSPRDKREDSFKLTALYLLSTHKMGMGPKKESVGCEWMEAGVELEKG